MEQKNRSLVSVSALVLLAILFVALSILSSVFLKGMRFDLTENSLYTLSDGTHNILQSMDEPVTLTLFFSEDVSRDLPQFRSYARWAGEMLEEFEANSDGMLTLRRVDPRAFSPQEDQAAQEMPPGNRNATPAIPPALPNGSPFYSPYYAQPRNPYEDLRRMRRHMERVFNDRQNTYKRPDFYYHFSQDISVPEMEVREDDRQYIVLVNIPGADERNISVKLEGQRLTVRGKQMHQKQDRDASGRIIFSERRSGNFQRSITLHAAVEERGMKTRIDNGVLTIIIPKQK